VIRLGLRLTLNGGKEAIARLVITTLAAAIGVGMLLITLAGINAVNTQNGRYAWLETGAGSVSDRPSASATVPPDPLWWQLTADEYRGQLLGRIDVAATGPHSPIPPGMTQLPGPGQFYASPALSKLLHSTPPAELGDRFPGTEAGTIGAAALPSPNMLLIVVGHTPAELAHAPNAKRVLSISTTNPSSCNGDCYYIGIDASGIDLVLSVTAAALLFPVLIFIGTATRLSAARREQRFAAMRLVGATPQQVSIVSAVESTVAAVAGVVLGFGLFFLLRPALAPIPFTGTPFFASDLSLNLTDMLVVAVGVPVAAAVAARLALRRVTISPLGVTRRVTPRPPRAWRLIPLLAGIGELAYFVLAGRPATTPGQLQAFMTGILLTMAGLVIAGPWLTMVGARVMSGRTSRPAVLISGRRLADNPQAGFRAISGLVLALFVTSVAIGAITTIRSYDGGGPGGIENRDTLIVRFVDFNGTGRPARSIPSVPAALTARLRAIPGVHAVTVIYGDPAAGDGSLGPRPSLVSCSALAATPGLGRCPAGASVASVQLELGGSVTSMSSTVWPAASVSSDQLPSLPVRGLAIDAQGSRAAVEQARTVLEQAYPYKYFPLTIAEDQANSSGARLTRQYEQLADVVILASLPIAGCSLAVSVVAGLSDRKRPFSLLRLSGAPLGVLRRVVALESAVPLIGIAVLSIGIGFLTAGLFLEAQLDETLQAPGLGYYLIVATGIGVSLAIIASTMPLLERITGPQNARND
jgi:FtsX-like permease family protein